MTVLVAVLLMGGWSNKGWCANPKADKADSPATISPPVGGRDGPSSNTSEAIIPVAPVTPVVQFVPPVVPITPSVMPPPAPIVVPVVPVSPVVPLAENDAAQAWFSGGLHYCRSASGQAFYGTDWATVLKAAATHGAPASPVYQTPYQPVYQPPQYYQPTYQSYQSSCYVDPRTGRRTCPR